MNRMKHILPFLPVAMLLAACTQDDPISPTEGVEGAPPLHFTASIGPATRATTDNVWNGETVQVQIVDNYTSGTPQWDNGTQQTYTVASGGTMTKIEGTKDAYWQANGEVKAIRAWYAPEQTDLPATWQVQLNQSADGNYEKSDFLFAQRTAVYPNDNSSVSLNFYHQVAKVKVNILEGDETPAGLSVTGLTIGGIATSGTFTAPALDGTTTTPLGTWSVTSQMLQSITPHAVTDTGDNTLAAYEALVIPQTVSGSTWLFTISAIGYSDFLYTSTEAITWQSGMEYTYNITIKGSELEVTTSQSIGWDTGSTGSGSVTLPIEIDLSQATGNITIEDDNTYLLTGSGSTPVTIRGNATVILQNVSLNTSTGNAISVESGNPTIHVKGTSNSVTGNNGAGIFVAEGSTVTVTGDSRDDQLAATGGNGSSGIGGYRQNEISSVACGNIFITNVTVYAQGSIDAMGNLAPGIGSTGNATCGTITIDNATVQAYGCAVADFATPGIGCGIHVFSLPSSIPIVIIRNQSDVYAHRGVNNNLRTDYIGWSVYSLDPSYVPANSAINCGTGGGVYSSTVYCYTGETQLDKTVEYDENGQEIK